MAAVWGRAEIIVEADGRLLPAQVRRMAGQAGREGGLSYRRSFLAALGRQFGRDIANSFRPAIQELNRRLSPAFTRLRTVARNAFAGIRGAIDPTVQRFRNMGLMIRSEVDVWRRTFRDFGDEWRANLDQRFPNTMVTIRRVGRAFTDFGAGLRRLFTGQVRADIERFAADVDGLNPRISNLGNTLRSATRDTDGFGRSWKSLPHGFRQFVFWTGLVIAGMGTMSVLGSALSGTIVALSTILAGIGTAAGIAVAGFVGLFEEGAKLSAGAQATKAAFQELGQAFQNLQAGIVENMFANMAGSIQNITNVLVPALEGSINNLAASAGQNISRIFDALSSPGGVANFQALLDGFVPILDSMTTAAIGFGDAIGDILVASLPTAQRFADAIANVATQFSTWTSSDAGRARITKFFETAERIMPLVVDLAVALGRAIANLVTPTTIAGAETFITSLTNFMPILGQIVGIVANLNVFGVLAAALQAVGAVLEPLLPPLAQFATILGQMLVEGLQQLMPALSALGAALAPFVTIISTLVQAILPPLITIIQSVIEYITSFAEALLGADRDSQEFKEGVRIMGEVVGNIFNVLATIIQVSLSIIGGLLKSTSQLLRGDFSGAFKTMEGVARGVFAALGLDFDKFIQWVNDMVREGGNLFRDIGRTIENFGRTVANVFGGIVNWIRDAVNWFGRLFGAANNASGAVAGASGGGRPRLAFASGGVLNGPRRILAGEAGPEAIVPLNRALSQVDPSVRWLSAIAQGITPMATGGVVGGGRVVNVNEGAVIINGAIDPQRTALTVVNRLAERIAG